MGEGRERGRERGREKERSCSSSTPSWWIITRPALTRGRFFCIFGCVCSCDSTRSETTFLWYLPFARSDIRVVYLRGVIAAPAFHSSRLVARARRPASQLTGKYLRRSVTTQLKLPRRSFTTELIRLAGRFIDSSKRDSSRALAGGFSALSHACRNAPRHSHPFRR